jgi:hypothetical protein
MENRKVEAIIGGILVHTGDEGKRKSLTEERGKATREGRGVSALIDQKQQKLMF